MSSTDERFWVNPPNQQENAGSVKALHERIRLNHVERRIRVVER
ncbi:MAG: hypothetical protein ACFFE8_03665 [Candidatus Heimdallarchaeota archaeon]